LEKRVGADQLIQIQYSKRIGRRQQVEDQLKIEEWRISETNMTWNDEDDGFYSIKYKYTDGAFKLFEMQKHRMYWWLDEARSCSICLKV